MEKLIVPAEIRCANCGRLHATVTANGPSGWAIHVKPPGLQVVPVNVAEQFGVVLCDCGHRTPLDLRYLGVA